VTTDALLKVARLDAFEEIRSDLFHNAADALQRHGDDPAWDAILGAALVAFVGEIDANLSPGFRRLLVKMLQEAP